MKVLGVVAEYNPFHNGHAYHLNKSRQMLGECSIVCVMSGNYIQRGEPAIIDKWSRAEAALLSGADLVIELPVAYAMSSAEFFAWAAVKLLESTGIVDNISFGSETEDMGLLEEIATVLSSEPEEYRKLLRMQLQKGISYPSARSKAIIGFIGQKESMHKDIEKVMASPNCILGIEYLKALKRLDSKIKPILVGRSGSSYNSEVLEGSFSSATSIRKHIAERGNVLGDKLRAMLPEISFNIMKREFEAGRGPVFPGNFEALILASVRRSSPEQLASLPYVSEGLENRIKEASYNSGSLEEMINLVSTKRYPRTRIQRILFHMLTGLTEELFNEFNESGGPQYIRILGFNSKGRKLLAKMRTASALPVVIKASDHLNSPNPLINSMLSLEAASTDVYVLGFNDIQNRIGGREFTQNPIVVQ